MIQFSKFIFVAALIFLFLSDSLYSLSHQKTFVNNFFKLFFYYFFYCLISFRQLRYNNTSSKSCQQFFLIIFFLSLMSKKHLISLPFSYVIYNILYLFTALTFISIFHINAILWNQIQMKFLIDTPPAVVT